MDDEYPVMKLQTFSQLRAQHELEQLAATNRDLLSIEDRGCEEGDWLAEIIIDCDGMAVSNGRVEIGPKECFMVRISADFPFAYPLVEVQHDRFADLPHVQWGRHICLYASANDWDPRRGMTGFVHRLALWLESAASGKLEGPEAPWHIPVAYPSAGEYVVAKADIPDEAEHAAGTWVGWAIVAYHASYHLEIVGWLDTALAPSDHADWISWVNDVLAGYTSDLGGLLAFTAPIMALTSSMGFEYPRKLGDLLEKINAHQLSDDELIRTLLQASRCNEMVDQSQYEESVTLPLLFLIGSPSWDKEVKTRVAALAAWHIERFSARALAALAKLSNPDISDVQSKAEYISVLREWPIEWARVFDQRPQVTLRRDEGRPAQWLRSKRVLVLGCGALGAPLAEHCVRAGCQSVELVDTGGVHPGLLVRQPYEYDDIGLPKVGALADRLHRVRPEAVIVPTWADALDVVPEAGSMPPDFDLIIDATANHAVAAKIERNRWRSRGVWPPVLTVVVGHKAERGIGMLSPPGATGAAVDILRQVLLECGRERRLTDFTEDFLQENSDKDPFVPERGCSEPTFAGSSLDVSAIVSTLLNGALAQLSRSLSSVLGSATCRSAQVIRNPTYSSWPAGGYQMSWDQDTIVHDKLTGYEVRIASEAWETMRHAANIADIGWADSPRAETGGLLYGQIDSASMVIWVTIASGPSKGSVASSVGILLNTAAERQHNKELLRQSRGAISFIGMWHSHPNSVAKPSPQDILTMRELTSFTQTKSPTRLLLLILGFGSGSGQWDHYLNEGTPPGLYAQLFPESPH